MMPNAPNARTFLLMGSGEFEPWSNEIDAAALDGRTGPVAVLPTASSTEGEEVFGRWGRMALEHYATAGIDARLVPVKTREDADREDLARALEGAAMVFFSGGKPKHLAATIQGTRLWDALEDALDDGAVFAGCSAGALIASQSREQRRERGVRTGWVFGLGLVPHVSFGVHWDKVKVIPGLRSMVMSRIPSGSWFVGIDEYTAILGDGHRWRVFGLGSVMVRHAGGTLIHRSGRDLRDVRSGIAVRRISLSTVVSTDEPIAPEHQPTCYLCGRPTYDPGKRERPWVRATSGGRQVLVCPSCQEERPDWAVQLDRCESCGATRLTAMLGQVVCRACGHVRGEPVEPAWMTTGA